MEEIDYGFEGQVGEVFWTEYWFEEAGGRGEKVWRGEERKNEKELHQVWFLNG